MPEWLLLWWKHLGGGELRVMAFRENGDLAGVLPLFLHQWDGRRQLTLIGSGISDYLDPSFALECTPHIIDRILEELSQWSDWDICDWQDLSPDTPLAALGTRVKDSPCSFIPLDLPFEEYMASRPKDLKRNLRRSKERRKRSPPWLSRSRTTRMRISSPR